MTLSHFKSPMTQRRQTPREGGSAILIVLILLVLMSVMVVHNALILRHLKRELALIEQKQLNRIGSKSGPANLSPPAPDPPHQKPQNKGE